MYDIKSTEIFTKWLSKLKDTKGRIAVARRIERMTNGNFGDIKPINASISELRITVGAGYRVYFTKRDKAIIILLIGGDKSTQAKDIKKAKKILKELDNE